MFQRYSSHNKTSSFLVIYLRKINTRDIDKNFFHYFLVLKTFENVLRTEIYNKVMLTLLPSSNEDKRSFNDVQYGQLRVRTFTDIDMKSFSS